jgi:hypothetical protein
MVSLSLCRSGQTDSSSPSRQSSNNPFARKSTVGSPAPSASSLGVSPSPAPVNPFGKAGGSSGGRPSGLTISSAVEALIISPPSSASSNNGSARNGSDPAIVPPPTQSPAPSRSNASTPLVHADRRENAHAHRANADDEIRRPVGHRERRSHPPHQQQHLYEDPDVTPRSHHNANTQRSHATAAAAGGASSSTTAPAPSFSFDERDVKKKTPRSGSGSETPLASSATQKWKCENPKCQKWNSGNPDYCDHCAVRRGATGARGAAAKLYLQEDS